MKLLVSTKRGQGQRPTDFNFVPEDEPLMFAFECDTDKKDVDGVCGCRRSMSGLYCGRGTTTFKVAEVDDMTPERLEQELTSYYQKAWKLDEAEAQEWAKEDVPQLIDVASSMPEGQVIEKRGKWLKIRPEGVEYGKSKT